MLIATIPSKRCDEVGKRNFCGASFRKIFPRFLLTRSAAIPVGLSPIRDRWKKDQKTYFPTISCAIKGTLEETTIMPTGFACRSRGLFPGTIGPIIIDVVAHITNRCNICLYASSLWL